MVRGSYWTRELQKRRRELLEKLKSIEEPTQEKYQQALSLFAFEQGLTEEKVSEYYATLKKAGLI